MKVDKAGDRIELKHMDAATMQRVGANAIALRRDDIVQRSLGSSGTPMPAYSPKGPIYVATTGRGRTKTSLKGRQVLTEADLRAARRAGSKIARTRSKKSAKFPNYSAYKKALGKSGNRDLELSGSMLNSITIVRQSKNSVSYGFTREVERKKAEGNEKIAPFFGLSPDNQKQVGDEFEAAHGEPLQFKKV
jgi:hypothetical protein